MMSYSHLHGHGDLAAAVSFDGSIISTGPGSVSLGGALTAGTTGSDSTCNTASISSFSCSLQTVTKRD